MSLARQLADAVSSGELTATATIKMWGKATIPDGWLECDGSAVSRTTYADLFAEIGTGFGVGDGSTTFNLPDLQDNVPVGKSGTKALGSTGGAASVSPSVTDNITVSDNIAVSSNITASDNIAVNKTGEASGSMTGAPDAGNLAVSVSGNVSVSNHTLSVNEIASHSHNYNAGGGGSARSASTGNTASTFSSGGAGGSGSHSHGSTHNLSGSMTGAPGLGTLGVTINDNIAVTKTGDVTLSGNVDKSGNVAKSGTVSVADITTLQPYQAVIFIIKT